MTIKNLAFFGVMASIFAVSAAQALDTPATRIATVGYVKSNAAQADYNDTTTQLGASTIQGAIEAIVADVADIDQTAGNAIHTLTDGNTTGSVVTNVTENNGTITVTKGDLAYSNITGTPDLTLKQDKLGSTNVSDSGTGTVVTGVSANNGVVTVSKGNLAYTDITGTPDLSGYLTATDISGKQDKLGSTNVSDSGTGSVVTGVSASDGVVTVTKGNLAYTDITGTPDLTLKQDKLGSTNVSDSGTGTVVTGVSANNGVVTVSKGNLAYSDITGTPTLATVATTGAYSDLSGTPTIPTVDQTYDATSPNAQSGVAIAGVLGTVPANSTVMNEISSASGTATNALQGVATTTGTGEAITAVTEDANHDLQATKSLLTYNGAMNSQLSHFDTPNVAYANGDCTDAMPCVLTFTGSKYVWTALDIPAAAQSGGGN